MIPYLALQVTTEKYVHEQDMEEAYFQDLIKAYHRTLRDRKFPIVIVDAPNLCCSHLASLWEAGQKTGYEIFIAEV